MEFKPFTPGPEMPPSTNKKEKSESTSEKKKLDKRTLSLAEIATEKAMPAPKPKEASNSLSDFMAKQLEAARAPKPDKETTEVSKKSEDLERFVSKAQSNEALAHHERALTAEEVREYTDMYAEDRLDELDQGEGADQKATLAAETAADRSLLLRIREKLAAGLTTEAAVQDAEAETSHDIDPDRPYVPNPELPAPAVELDEPVGDEAGPVPMLAGGGGARGGAGTPPGGSSERPADDSSEPFNAHEWFQPRVSAEHSMRTYYESQDTPQSSAENVIPTSVAARREQQAATRGVIAGGVIGYLAGRRRGRIRTERKFAQVEKQLEGQVAALQQRVSSTEQRVRKLAAEKIAAVPVAEQQVVVERIAAPVPALVERTRMTVPAKPAERLGQVVLESAAPVSARTLERPKASSRAETVPDMVRFDKETSELSSKELMQAAEKVKVDGATLREVYESKRIDEPGLRRIMTEFFRGGDVRKALVHETLEKELSFERDPQLRKQADRQQAAGGGKDAGSIPTDEAAESQLNESLTGQAPDRQANRPIPDAATIRRLRNQQLAAVGGVALVVLLAVIIVMLLMR